MCKNLNFNGYSRKEKFNAILASLETEIDLNIFVAY